MFEFIKKYFCKERTEVPSFNPVAEDVVEETIGEPASLLLWSLENEVERWEKGTYHYQGGCGAETVKDTSTGKSYTVSLQPIFSWGTNPDTIIYSSKLIYFPWMNEVERKVLGKAVHTLYQTLHKREREEKNAQQREEMFKEFGRSDE